MPLMDMPLSLPELFPIGTLIPFINCPRITLAYLSPDDVKFILPVVPINRILYHSVPVPIHIPLHCLK